MKQTTLFVFVGTALVLMVAAVAWRRTMATRRPNGGLTLEESGENSLGPCEHCGKHSRLVWGYVRRAGATRCAYFVHWTLGISEHPAGFDLIIGTWGDGAAPAQRVAVSLLYRNDGGQPSFMVIDAVGRRTDSADLVGRALSRAEVVGTPFAEEVYELVDFILYNETRIGTIQTKLPNDAGPGF